MCRFSIVSLTNLLLNAKTKQLFVLLLYGLEAEHTKRREDATIYQGGELPPFLLIAACILILHPSQLL